MKNYSDVIQDRYGNGLRGTVTVTVTGTSDLAELFAADGSVPIDNPVTSDTDGRFSFYVISGRYDLTTTVAGYAPSTQTDVLIFDPAEPNPGNVIDELGYHPEDVANKSSDTSLGTSDELYPTQQAVKVYSDDLAAATLATAQDYADAGDALLVPQTTTVNGHALSGNVTVSKSDVGLGNADNTSDVNKPVSSAQASADAAVLAASETYADGLVVGLWDDRGNYDASVNTFPAAGGSGSAGAVKKGDIWTISVAGTLGGHAVTIGDAVRAKIDTPGQTDANWAILENNIGYVPENEANKDASGGYPGLTLFKLHLRNAANTLTSFFTTAATVARTWTFPDKDGTVAMTSDITGTNSGVNTGDETGARVATLLHAASVKSALVDADEVNGTDSANSFSLIRTTWTSVKAFLKTYFDTLYVAVTTTVNGKALSSNVTLGLASSDFANQGTTTTVLHGNAAGNPAFGAVVEADITLADNTTNNVSTTKHGLVPKAPNDATKFLDGTGAYSVPASGSGVTSVVIQKFTASGTYTPTASMKYCIIEALGSGGGGGGGPSGSGAAGGGSGGTYARSVKSAAAIGASQAVTIGAGGAAGTTGNNGSNGNTTSVGSLVTAPGGLGGIGGVGNSTTDGGAPSSAGTADLSILSGRGGPGWFTVTVALLLGSSRGGFGSPAPVLGVEVTNAIGATSGNSAPANSGSGGAGGADVGGGTGGVGGSGLVIITEFI